MSTIPTPPPGVSVTYVRDPAVAGAGSTTITGGTVAVDSTGIPLRVFVTGGTSTAEVIFTGTINTDIGQVEIEDASGNKAVTPSAQDAKTGATKALVVQHIDDTGTPLREATQTDIRSALSAVLNAQGTQSTGALALNTTAQTGNTLLTAVLNTQGTQSTGALALEATQQSGNNLLTAILNSQRHHRQQRPAFDHLQQPRHARQSSHALDPAQQPRHAGHRAAHHAGQLPQWLRRHVRPSSHNHCQWQPLQRFAATDC